MVLINFLPPWWLHKNISPNLIQGHLDSKLHFSSQHYWSPPPPISLHFSFHVFFSPYFLRSLPSVLCMNEHSQCPQYTTVIQARVTFTWVPAAASGSPRWPVTDADNCCPWWGCIPLPSSLKTWINLCFQSYSPPPGPPADPSPLWPRRYLCPASVTLFYLEVLLCHLCIVSQPKVCFFFSFSQHFSCCICYWWKGGFVAVLLSNEGARHVWQTHCVQRGRQNITHAVTASYDDKCVAATVGNVRSYGVYIPPHGAFKRLHRVLFPAVVVVD